MNSILRTVSRLAVLPIRGHMSPAQPRAAFRLPFLEPRRFAHNVPLTYDFARERIMLVLHLFDKIDPNKLTLDSHFIKDLGLDSLDHTEIIMQMEDEFDFGIPEKDAEKLMTPADILRYVTDKEEAYKELQDMHAEHHGHGAHGHDSHGHGSHEHDSHKIGTDESGTSHGSSNINFNSKREFSSLSTMTKRYYETMKDNEYVETTFGSDPPEPPNFENIQSRVMKVCSKYDKIDSEKLTPASHFVTDLGLDSLDHVEIMMELEDEFCLEIPDQEAEKLMRPAEIIKYIFEKEEARMLKYQDNPV